MKKFIYMAVVAIAALSSCSNEDVIVANENGKGETTFFATMEKDAATRVALSGKTPCWESGDVISIDGHAYTAAEDVATTGAFTGEGATEATHHAYFPASMYSKVGEVVTITLPASYEYTAGKFNMPMYAESTTNSLQFKNLCGVLAITVPSTQMSSVTSIEVSSDQQMNGAISSITDAGVLTFAPATLTDAKKKVTLTASSAVTIATSETFYVPVPAGTHNPLKITVSNGTIARVMTTKKSGGVTVERNKIYPITFADNSEYVVINGLKWAKKNVGATAENNWGDFFAWGETEPRYTSYTRNSDNTVSFTWKSKYSSSGYVSSDYVYPEYVFDVNYDAATANWGSNWRTPSKAEFVAMYAATKWTWVDTEKGYYVTEKDVELAADKSNALLFFPAAGYLSGTSHYSNGIIGYYWSCSSAGTDQAFILYFTSSTINPSDTDDGYYGHMVRPVSN